MLGMFKRIDFSFVENALCDLTDDEKWEKKYREEMIRRAENSLRDMENAKKIFIRRALTKRGVIVAHLGDLKTDIKGGVFKQIPGRPIARVVDDKFMLDVAYYCDDCGGWIKERPTAFSEGHSCCKICGEIIEESKLVEHKLGPEGAKVCESMEDFLKRGFI